MEEYKRVLPPKEVKQINLKQEELKKYLYQAYKNFLPYLQRGMTEYQTKNIYLPTEKGWNSYIIEIPTRYTSDFHDQIKKANGDGIFDNLINYLWKSRAITKEISGKDTPPGKDAFRYFVVTMEIIPNLYNEIENSIIRKLIENNLKLSKPWISNKQLARLANKVAYQWVNKIKTINVKFFPRSLDIGEYDYLKLSECYSINGVTTKDICLYLSKYDEKILKEETFGEIPLGGSIFNQGMIEIEFNVKRSLSNEKIIKRVQEKLNIFRLSIALVKFDTFSIGEGLIFINIDDPFNSDEIKRLIRKQPNSWSSLKLNIENAEKLIDKIKKINKWSRESNDLKRAIWRFGRACSAETYEDQLVESIIGMEGLVIPNSGEVRYRFSTNSTYLLQTVDHDPENLYKEMKKLYDMRSKAVHGESDQEIKEQSDKAIKYFIKCIDRIISLLENNQISDENNIAESLQKKFYQNIPNLVI